MVIVNLDLALIILQTIWLRTLTKLPFKVNSNINHKNVITTAVQTTKDCVFEGLLCDDAKRIAGKEWIQWTAHFGQVSVDRWNIW